MAASGGDSPPGGSKAMTLVQRQLIRYAVVGFVSNLLCYLIYLGLTRLGMNPKVAMSLLYGLGVLQTFVFNKRWTFDHGGTQGAMFYRYCAAYGFGYLFNLVALYLLVDLWGYPHQIIQGLMILLLAIMLFLAQKFWVFRAD
jgi:putative flippase GtrA